MTMRIRQVKPAFFTDARIAELSPAVRLFYIGLWMLADDAGWLWWDVAEVGNELYGYEPRGRRERNCTAFLAALEASKRVIHHDCGHVQIPSFAEHQRFGGATRQLRATLHDHESRCIRTDARTLAQARAGIGIGNGTVSQGTERIGSVSQNARTREEMSEFQEKVPRLMALGGEG